MITMRLINVGCRSVNFLQLSSKSSSSCNCQSIARTWRRQKYGLRSTPGQICTRSEQKKQFNDKTGFYLCQNPLFMVWFENFVFLFDFQQVYVREPWKQSWASLKGGGSEMLLKLAPNGRKEHLSQQRDSALTEQSDSSGFRWSCHKMRRKQWVNSKASSRAFSAFSDFNRLSR